MKSIIKQLQQDVINSGICVNCGLCVALDENREATMQYTNRGPQPFFSNHSILSNLAWQACPGKGIHYANLYHQHYGSVPDNCLLGQVKAVRIGYAAKETIRHHAASGGIITATLLYLLHQSLIDDAIVVKQDSDHPEIPKVVITHHPEEIISCAQSVYVPVAMLETLSILDLNKRYAITCSPEQAAALRYLQHNGHKQAQQIHYVLGHYTGTSLYPDAIRAFLSARGVAKNDKITALKWRAGQWPGYLEIKLASGKLIRAMKFYYNYLIPFFITQTSLQSMDFMNEFADLSVGDAWSPHYETKKMGFSVFTTRTQAMEEIIVSMLQQGWLVAEAIDPAQSLNMHGHMLDFKKRGSYIRNRIRSLLGKSSPNYGFKPIPITIRRILVESIIVFVFFCCQLKAARWLVSQLPDTIIGPMFNIARKIWKNLSKPTKRKGLANLKMKEIMWDESNPRKH
ncbi:MAG TPA: Coenzyme F420 hydrogenase/dehydrogenase, beta subunit C-terminal domain [Gammaproteobacteria bacterium]|nr:Coenzyme F420 hydrogenase/dehydrogenase, beta subunit C-terminal domain [Gammaproteobacteria bacterium]